MNCLAPFLDHRVARQLPAQHLQLSESDAAHAMAQRELDGRRAGNTLEAGQTYPARIVRVFDGSPAANLQVFLDGNDALWCTSRIEGDEPDGGAGHHEPDPNVAGEWHH